MIEKRVLESETYVSIIQDTVCTIDTHTMITRFAYNRLYLIRSFSSSSLVMRRSRTNSQDQYDIVSTTDDVIAVEK